MKTTLLYVCAAILAVASAVSADDIKLADGKTVYHNAKITSSDAASVTIKHSTGIAHVPIPDLPHELRAQFNYDPGKAQELLTAQQKAAASENIKQIVKQMDNAQPREHLNGKILQISSEGVLLHILGKDQPIIIRHVDTGNHVDGDNVSIDAVPAGTFQYVNAAGSTSTIRAYDAGP
jgi:hypothetical protein